MHQRHHRARHHVLARGEDAADVLHRLERAQIRRGGVADAVGVEREDRVDVGGGADADRVRAAQLARVLAGFRVAVHADADQLAAPDGR